MFSQKENESRERYDVPATPAYLTTGDKLWGTTVLAGNRAEVIKQTYLLLGVSIVFAVAGGWIGATTPAIVNLFSGWIGWILAMVVLNVAPRIAIAARHNPVLGVTALVGDGFVSGMVLAPILYIASLYAPGAIQGAVRMAREEGLSVSRVHLRHLNPLPPDLGAVLGRFARVLVPEMNRGQLALLLRARYLVDVVSYPKIQGRPFFRSEILARIRTLLGASR